jgi:outer membrane protein, multidrug efflux system
MAAVYHFAPDLETLFAKGTEANLPSPVEENSTKGVAGEWWKSFGDDTLNGLISAGLVNNSSLQAATSRLQESLALRRKSLSDFFPSVVPNTTYTESQASAAGTPGIPASALRNAYFDVGADVSWEIDIIGRLRRAYEAQDARVESTFYTMQSVYQLLVHDILVNYLEARGSHKESIIAEETYSAQQKIVDLVRLMENIGTRSEIEVLDAERQLAEFEIARADIKALRDTRIATLAYLCHLQPKEVETLITAAQNKIPSPPQIIQLGLPQELLQYRPDIVAKERELAAATADIGFEKADYWPRVSLSGGYGYQAVSFTDIGRTATETFLVTPRIAWAFLDFGTIRSRVNAAGARAQTALAEYQDTIGQAVKEVEQAIIQLRTDAMRVQAVEVRDKAAERQFMSAKKQYDIGTLDDPALYVAKNSRARSLRELIQSKVVYGKAVAGLYKALGQTVPYLPDSQEKTTEF